MKKPLLACVALLSSTLLFFSLSVPAFAAGAPALPSYEATQDSLYPAAQSEDATASSDSSSSASSASSSVSGSSSASTASTSSELASSSTSEAPSTSSASSSSSESASADASSASIASDSSSESLMAIEALSSLSDPIIIDSNYLTPGTNGRQELDLKRLKDNDLLEGTLVIEGTAANKAFVKIVDTSTDITGNYNILLGEYGGVEIPAATGTLNTFQSITNKQGIANMMPIYTAVSVDTIAINNNGSKINLLATISFDIPYPSPTYKPVRNLAIAVVGQDTHVETLSITDISITGYIQGHNATYVYPSLIGPQEKASVNNFIVGNIDISYANAQIGALIGASSGKINHFEVNGNVNLTGTVLSGGLPSATYSPVTLIGVTGNDSVINDLTLTSTAKITAKDISGYSSGVQIGFTSYNSAQSEGRLVFEPGSDVNFINFKAGSTLVIPIGGEAKVMDFGGKITMSTFTSSTGTFIGKGYDSSITNEMLLIRGTSEINITSANYVGTAIGYNANVAYTAMKNLIIEKGAKINLSITKPYSIRDYYNVDMAIGGNRYCSPDNFLIGATYNAEKGIYEVVPTSDTSNQTEIRLTNYRMLASNSSSTSLVNFYRKAQLNANVYAEYSTAQSEFFGGFGNNIIIGGNYLVKEVTSDTLSYISFNEKRTGSYNSLQSAAYNQYFEPLSQKMYMDDTGASSFPYHVIAAGFDGLKPDYDYYMASSFNSSIPATYKALYYPTRRLNARLSNPVPNGDISVNGTIAIEFDLPVYSADHVNKGKTITLYQGSEIFTIPLDDANKDKYTFGSDVEGGNPNMLYINLPALTSENGQPLTPNTATALDFPGPFSFFFYQDNPQLAGERTTAPYWFTFYATEAVYTVNFDLNGAPGTTIPSQEILKGTTVSEPVVPVWEEHTFEGWNISSGTEFTPWNFSDNVYSDMTLVALWKTNTYQVTYTKHCRHC